MSNWPKRRRWNMCEHNMEFFCCYPQCSCMMLTAQLYSLNSVKIEIVKVETLVVSLLCVTLVMFFPQTIITTYLIIIRSIYTILYNIIHYLYCLNVNCQLLYTLCEHVFKWMTDKSGKVRERSGKSQGILIPCVSGNPAVPCRYYQPVRCFNVGFDQPIPKL